MLWLTVSIFAILLLINSFMIRYTWRRASSPAFRFRIRSVPSDEEVLSNLSELAELARQEEKKEINFDWHKEGF